MTTFSNNPHTAYNGVVSGQRNMFLSSSLAVVMIGFANNFESNLVKYTVKTLGLFIFLLSIFIGMKATYEFHYYLDYYKGKLPEHIPVESWYMWSYVAYTYTFILLFVAVMFFSSKMISRK
jgi:uncharacterized membrane-anchored protein